MDQQRWERMKDIVEAALELSPERRLSFLAKICEDDAALRGEVEALLEHHQHAGSFLEGSPAQDLHASVASRSIDPTFSPGDMLSGRFQIVRFIGHGGMGEVYEAKDLELGARVALKTLRPEISADSRALNRFKQEVQLARRVTHPNVCRMFDIARHHVAGEGGDSNLDRVFLTMELLEGESLSDRLRRQHRFDLVEAWPIIQQMAEGLQAAHEAGVIHRDFKPSNVILADARIQTRTVVTDFGLARAVASSASVGHSLLGPFSMTGQVIGTLAYMAPEQLEGREPTPATDVYALGLVVYEMLTGNTPFPEHAPLAGALLRLKEQAPSPRMYWSELDPNCEQAIMRCLRTDSSERFQSAREAAEAFGTVLAGPSRPVSARPDAQAQIAPRPPAGKRFTSTILLSAVVASLLVGLSVYRWGYQSHVRSAAARAHSVGEVIAGLKPVPEIFQPLVPPSIVPGGSGFALTVNGAGFGPASVVRWNGYPIPTKFISRTRLMVAVPAAIVTKPGTAWITVGTASEDSAASNMNFLPVTKPTPGLFFTRTAYTVGNLAYNLAVGDFNRDGNLDLVSADREAGTVSVLLGNGNGTFQKATSYEVGPWPVAVAVADFNRDGKPDIVTANSDDRTISVLLGNGDGTFRPAKTYTSGLEPTFVAVGDFNCDGAPDLAVANSGEGTVSILLGNGDGTFRAAVKYGGFVNPDAVQVGDFNVDDKLDLVVANSGSASVGMLLGNGDGTFQSAINSAAGDSPSSIAVADLNGDGKPDLVIANRDTNALSVLLGKGDGTFLTPVSYNVTYYPRPVIIGDFDGDGKLDLAVVNGFVGTVSILFGNGDGTFQRPTSFSAGVNPSSLVAGDFNGDGRLDLALTNFAGPATVSVLLQAPTVTLGTDARDFGSQPVGNLTGTAAAIAMSNAGSATLEIHRIDVTGPNHEEFSQTNNCGVFLVGGSACMIQVKFRPVKTGFRRAMVVVTDNAAGSPHRFIVTGTGTK